MQRDTKGTLSAICTSLDDICVTSGCQTGIYNNEKKKHPTNLQILIMMKYYLEMSTLRLVTGYQPSLVAQNLPAMQETQVRSLGWEDPLEKDMASDSSILAWRIPWVEEPGGLLSGG